MTEQQIKRIQEAVNTPDTAIQCETKEEARMLFEAMGWEWEKANMPWRGNNRVYHADSFWPCGWDRHYTAALAEKSIIPFSTLLTPEPCGLVKAFRAVGVDWIDEGNLFEFEGAVYRVDWHNLMRKNGKEWHTCRVNHFVRMLNNPHKIRPVRVWSEAMKRTAQIFLDAGNKSVEIFSNEVHVECDDGSGFSVPAKMFPELKPGECVALADIAGG